MENEDGRILMYAKSNIPKLTEEEYTSMSKNYDVRKSRGA